MSKKVLIISGSPRKGGNSDKLCDRFAEGARDAGHSVTKVSLADCKVGFCTGCNCCGQTHRCIIDDDVPEIIGRMMTSDVIVMASPVYFYSVDAQIKALIDRSVSVWTVMRDKVFYFIMTSAEDSETVMDCTLECFRGFISCITGSTEGGVIFAKGVHSRGEIDGTDYMQQAYDMGRSV